MSSVQITNFERGIDRRRPRVAGIPGTLWVGKNCHISRGGDIEGVKKFVSQYTLPASTFGLEQVNGQLFVFGSADLAASIPNGVQYQRLQTAGENMIRVLHSVTFDGKIYVITEDDNGGIKHFYNGSRVSAWDAMTDAASSQITLAEYMGRQVDIDAAVDAISFGASILVTARTPGTPFTLTGSASGVGTLTVTDVQANVAEVLEVRATGSVTITGGTAIPGVNQLVQITVHNVPLLGVAHDWFQSNNATANAVAVEINNNTSMHGYTASVGGAVITIRAAPGAGATRNGFVVARTVAGDVTATTANMAGGVTYVAPVAKISKITLGGSFVATDIYQFTLNNVTRKATGRASAHGTYAFVYKGRVYCLARSLIRYCKLNDPTNWTDVTLSTGAGFINVASDAQGDQRLLSMAVFQNYTAVFSQKDIRLYTISADATENALFQAIANSGVLAARSVASTSTTDLLFLDVPGVRSIRTQDVTAGPYVDDTGTQLDTLFQEWAATVTERRLERAVAAIEPRDGRYLLAVGSRIFVLSSFPRSKIEAWTYYEPGFTVTDFVRVQRKLYARDTTKIYLYGGLTGEEYPDDDEQDISVELPFIGVKNPAEFKEWMGFDAACAGVWRVQALVDPNHENKLIEIGRITNTTYNHGGIGSVGESTLFALKLTCDTGGKVSISSLEMHYQGGDSEA